MEVVNEHGNNHLQLCLALLLVPFHCELPLITMGKNKGGLSVFKSSSFKFCLFICSNSCFGFFFKIRPFVHCPSMKNMLKAATKR